MLFLASFILKGQSQAALVAATMAILGLIVPPAAWISAAAIVLVTLVNGPQRGLITTALALIGAAVFAYLIFAVPQLALFVVFLVWLPAWIVASILRQTVSMAYSLQVLTAICLAAVAMIYAVYPSFGEFWREPLDVMVAQLAEQSDELNLSDLKQTQDWVIDFMPGLFASSILFGTLISLFLGRWWQAVFYNPGGFGEEFRSLNLGKLSAIIAIAIMLMAMVTGSVFAIAMVSVAFVLYSIQAMSIMHSVAKVRKLNTVWIFFAYMVMLFIPHLVLLLILLSIADPWLDIRQRVRPAT